METSVSAASGEGLLQELKSFPVLHSESKIRAEYGRVYRTKPYNLRPFHFILHAVTPKYIQGFSEERECIQYNQLKTCYSECMRITEEDLGRNAKLCTPLLGCGVNDWPVKTSVKLFIEASQEQKSPLDHIEVSFIEKKAYLQAEKALSHVVNFL